MDLMDLVKGKVQIMAEGQWSEDKVHVRTLSCFAPEITEEMRIAALSRFLTRRESNPKLFDGPARHLSLERSLIRSENDLSLHLAMGPMQYSYYDICREEFMRVFGWNLRILPIGMGMSAFILTGDSKIVMHKRGKDVDYPDILALMGGILDQDEPFEHVRKEFLEELGIERREISKLLLLGIALRLEQRINNELNFFARISPSSSQLMARQDAVKEKEGRLYFVDCDAQAMRKFLIENHSKMVAGQIFCFIQAGRHLWGQEWSKIRAES